MTPAALTAVTRTQGNNAALKDGRVSPAGVDLDFVEVPVLVHAFRRMVRGLEFDVCEMAATTYLCAREHGVRFTALPIFLVRGFHHGAIAHNIALGITHPKDLEGQRVGVNRGYTVTTGVWARGILEQEYGVDLNSITWVLSGDEHVAGYRPPPNVVAMPAGADLGEMLAAGDLAATIGVAADSPHIAPLIADAGEAGLDALRRTGHYPINHLVVVRNDVLDARPGLAADLFAAFAAAKNEYVEQLRRDATEAPTEIDRMYRRVMDVTGTDPLPYGIDPNRAVLEELAGHAVRQGILSRLPDIDLLFAPTTRGLVG
jgi:4,5-dihydroxyphthalate decarboxylase